MTLTIRINALAGIIFLLGTVVIADPAKIQGKVKEVNGKALAGVTIKATRATTRTLDAPDDSRTIYEAKTDDKGEFTLAGLPAGSYTLTFELEGFRTTITRQKLDVRDGEVYKAPKPFELSRTAEPYGLIRGAVLDESGYSLPNIRVTIERIDGGKFRKVEKESVEGGEFAFRVPAQKGTYRVHASGEGFVSTSREVTIDGDEIRQVVIRLARK